MAKQAYLRVEQLAHKAPLRDKEISYGLASFTVTIPFDNSTKVLLGRLPDLNLYPQYENISCIYLPSPYVARTLAIIHTSKTVYEDVHILQVLSDKQRFTNTGTDKAFSQKPLKSGDRFAIPFYKFKYSVYEDTEPSGDLTRETDTLI